MLQLILLTALANPWVITDQPVRTNTTPRRERVLFFSGSQCAPCKLSNAADRAYLVPAGWTFGGPECHVQQLLDATDLEIQYGVTSYPTYVFIRDGKEVRRSGYIGNQTIPSLFGVAKQQTKAGATWPRNQKMRRR